MPTTECATNIELPGPHGEKSQIPDAEGEGAQIEATTRQTGGASTLLKGLFIGFAATVTIGLGLAIWYLSVRIGAAGQVERSAGTNGPAHAVSASTPVAPSPSANQEAKPGSYWQTVSPGYLYLQVGGLGLKEDTDFASNLQAKGFHAQVQMRDGATTRVLIGPFSSQADMEEGQRRLREAGVIAVETAF